MTAMDQPGTECVFVTGRGAVNMADCDQWGHMSWGHAVSTDLLHWQHEPVALLHGAPVVDARGQRVVHVGRDELVSFVRTLRDEGWLQCLDVTAVDYLAHPQSDLPDGIEPQRFEVVVLLMSHAARERLRIRVQVPESDPVVPSLFEVHPGTEAMEREVFDMFGISFEGHPDLRRLLMASGAQLSSSKGPGGAGGGGAGGVVPAISLIRCPKVHAPTVPAGQATVRVQVVRQGSSTTLSARITSSRSKSTSTGRGAYWP